MEVKKCLTTSEYNLVLNEVRGDENDAMKTGLAFLDGLVRLSIIDWNIDDENDVEYNYRDPKIVEEVLGRMPVWAMTKIREVVQAGNIPDKEEARTFPDAGQLRDRRRAVFTPNNPEVSD